MSVKMRVCAIALFLAAPAIFALPNSTAVWEVRTTGSATNGGCFDSGATSPGTDYSQQDTPQVTYTDLAIGTTTQLTSAANPFTSASVGNCVQVTGGTGFTVGIYEVLSVAAGVATMDRAVGTASSTGGTGFLGGAITDVKTALAYAGYFNVIWLKAGTYSYTGGHATFGTSNTQYPYQIIGYQTTRGDYGTPPLITTSTNSTYLFSPAGTDASISFTNVNFSNTATTRDVGFLGANFAYYFNHCTFDGFTTAINNIGKVVLVNSQIINSTSTAVVTTSLIMFYSSITNSGGAAVTGIGTQGVMLMGSIIAHNGGAGISFTTLGQSFLPMTIINSVIAFNSGDGIKATLFVQNNTNAAMFTLQNTIIYGNTGYGINWPSASSPNGLFGLNSYNAFGSNTSGNTLNFNVGPHAVTLTANPFTSDTTGDYSLNSTAGGGTLLKHAGLPGVFQNGTSTAYYDIGAVQSAGTGGTGASNYGVAR